MKQKKHIKRIFSFVLATVLLISAIPISLAVQNLFAEATTPKIIREVTELREESVKHFLCEDGSYIAATYAAPVHYKENGEWKEIDNSLSLDRTVLSSSGNPTYTTKSGGLSVSIPQSFSDGQKITAQNKGYEISFGINPGQKNVSLETFASVVRPELLSSNTEYSVSSGNNVSIETISYKSDTEAYNAELMTVDNQSDAVTFKEILPKTDFEYVITRNSIKENIVVYECQNEYTYSFIMNFDGLMPVTHADGSISLVEQGKPDEFVYWIQAPYMYDTNREESVDIEMCLEENGTEYILTITANAEWINDKNRAFPVVIDPTIFLLDSEIDDVFVIDGLFANSPRLTDELRVGRNLTNVARTYIKPELPTNIPLGSKVSAALLELYKDTYYQAPSGNNISVYAYDCCNVATWDSEEISWNNQPFNNSDNGYQSTNGAVYLSEKSANASTLIYSFNIKAAVQRWVNGGINNGLMLVSSNESTKTQIDFVSSRATNSTFLPRISIEYEIPGTNRTAWTTGEEADSCTVAVTAALDWTATSNQSWITVTKYNSSFEIFVTENTGSQERTGEVIVTIGDTVIGKVTVNQYGNSASLSVDAESWKVNSDGDEKTITVNSNTSWAITTPDWITAEPSSGSGVTMVKLTAHANNNAVERIADVIVHAGPLSEVITVTQLDAVSNYFSLVTINDNGDEIITQRNSSEYYHPLATWSMALSYAAYNPVNYELFPGIPSSFMQEPYDDETKTAEAELESLGFDATSYNYDGGYSGYAAHTIGHKNIIIDETDGGIDNDISSNNNGSIGNSTVYSRVLSGDFSAIDTSFGESVATVLNSTSTEADSNSTRQLVVISVRGSVTPMDWVMDLANQINSECINFETGCQEILNSLDSYLALKGISDPIILVTGHSLGAAIANLVAAELNETEDASDIYSYTFATPNTINVTFSGEPTSYSNIFNFLNNNDLVPHFPMDGFVSEWKRYGQDFHITMPWVTEGIDLFEVDMLGVFGHGMPTYYSWINNLPGTLNKVAEELTVEDLEMLSEDVAVGFFAKFVKAKCPVAVTLYDSNGNIVAYESQQDGVVYPEITDVGIVSWITENNEKMFLIPYGCEAIDVCIEAYDYGTMNLTVEQPGAGEPLSTITYNDVNLSPDKEFLVEVSEETLPEDTQLFVTENGEVVGEVTDTNPFFKGVTVNPTEVVYGEPVTFTLVTDNTVTAMGLHGTHSGDHINISPDEESVHVAASGENEKTWTVTYYTYGLNDGENTYDMSVQSDGVWYFYENVIALNVTAS